MIMSGEQVSVDRAVKSTQEVTIEPNENASTSTNRVNINNLMSKVREEEKKQRKENLIFFGLIGSVIIITGVIASF